MNRIVAAYPGREIHVILDNLNTHKMATARAFYIYENQERLVRSSLGIPVRSYVLAAVSLWHQGTVST